MSIFERLDPTEECLWYGGSVQSPFKLDFLYFYIGEHNLASEVNFDPSFLSLLREYWHIEKEIIFLDKTKDKSSFRNFWYFPDYTKEDFLLFSNKVRLAKFLKDIDAYRHDVCISARIPDLDSKPWYIKSAHGFSGRGNFFSQPEMFGKELHKEVVIEEFCDRVCDFAITFLDNDTQIVYENMVGKGGQYLGSIINSDLINDLEQFLHVKSVSALEIKRFQANLDKIFHYFKQLHAGKVLRGSFDFFIYKKHNEFLIHPCCEFNPRWTMGRVAWHISQSPRLPQHKIFKTLFHQNHQQDFRLLSPAKDKFKFQYSLEF